MASWSRTGHGGYAAGLLLRVSMGLIFAMVTAASAVRSRPADLRVQRRFSRAMMSDASLQAPGGRNGYSNCDQPSGCAGSTQVCCNRECVDISKSSQSCGACNNQCAYNRECCDGVCVDAHASDPFNCGACGNVCADGVPCLFGMCGYSSGRIVP